MWVDGSQISPEHVEQVKTSASAVVKTIISVVGGAGSVIALLKTSMDLLQSRSLQSRRNNELERAGKLADLMGKFSANKVSNDHQEMLTDALRGCLEQCLEKVGHLNLRLAAISQDPNSRLKPYQKVLLAFRPADWRAWILHLLTYISVACCGWYVFSSGKAIGSDDFSLDQLRLSWQRPALWMEMAFLLVVAAIFRGWALEVRRRSLGYHKSAGPLARVLLVRFPEDARMMVAQLLFFLISMALITIIYSVFSDWRRAAIDIGFASLLLLFCGGTFLCAALIYRNWALAELINHQQKPRLVSSRVALFQGFFRNFRAYGWMRALFFLALVPTLVLMGFWVVWAFMAFDAGEITAGLIVLLTVPIPWVFNYALLRSLKIKYSLDGLKEVSSPQAVAAVPATIS